MGPGTLPEIIDCEHSSPCHPQMQVKALTCTQEATREQDPEMKKCSVIGLMEIPFGKHV